MVNIRRLENIVDNDSDVREKLFEFHKDNQPQYAGLNDYQASALFESHMANNTYKKVLVRMYSPQFEEDFPNHQESSRTTQSPRTPQTQSSDYLKNAYKNAATLGICSLAGIVASQFIDNQTVAENISYVSQLGLICTPVGTVIAYVKDKIDS